MSSIANTWRRMRRDRPAAATLAGVALGAGAMPLSVAAALCLLPVRLWPDSDDGGGGFGRGGDDHGGPQPAGDPDGGIDWERFEREVWEHIREREPIGV